MSSNVDTVPKKKERKKQVSLNSRQKLEMFERYDTGRYSLVDLARWYGCSDSTISNLIKRREEIGKDAVDQELEDALALTALEKILGTIATKIGKITSKMKDNEGALPMLNKSAKTVLDIRKQLTIMPKDLDTSTAPIDFETAYLLTELIPEEHREKYFQLMKGLTQSSGKKPKSDLAPPEELD